MSKSYHYKCPICNKEGSDRRRPKITCSRSCSMVLRNRSGLARIAGLASVKVQSRRSKNEILLSELCQEYFNNVLTNEPIFNGWDADIILEDHKLAILWNGKWHYQKIHKGHSLEQTQNRDKIKLKEIYKKGYTPYVITDLGKYSKNKVEFEFQTLLYSLQILS